MIVGEISDEMLNSEALRSGRVLAIVSLAACAHAGGRDPNAPVDLTAGDYDLIADADSGGKAGREVKGSVHLRPFRRMDPSFGRQYELYGWTDVDFRKLGAPISDADTPGSSEDSENPGVLVLVPRDTEGSRLAREPIMLIGTVENNKGTRGDVDGGGIGLFARTKEGECISGEWSEWGVLVGGRGHFTVCSRAPRPSPKPASN